MWRRRHRRGPGADAGGDHWASDLYGRLETAGQSPVRRPFAALNTLAARDGVLIRVTGPEGWLRVSVGTPAEMQAFRSALTAALDTTTEGGGR